MYFEDGVTFSLVVTVLLHLGHKILSFNELEAVLVRDRISFSRLHTTDCDHYLNWDLVVMASQHFKFQCTWLAIQYSVAIDREREREVICIVPVNVRKTVEWLDKQQQKTKAINLV